MTRTRNKMCFLCRLKIVVVLIQCLIFSSLRHLSFVPLLFSFGLSLSGTKILRPPRKASMHEHLLETANISETPHLAKTPKLFCYSSHILLSSICHHIDSSKQRLCQKDLCRKKVPLSLEMSVFNLNTCHFLLLQQLGHR